MAYNQTGAVTAQSAKHLMYKLALSVVLLNGGTLLLKKKPVLGVFNSFISKKSGIPLLRGGAQ